MNEQQDQNIDIDIKRIDLFLRALPVLSSCENQVQLKLNTNMIRLLQVRNGGEVLIDCRFYKGVLAYSNEEEADDIDSIYSELGTVMRNRSAGDRLRDEAAVDKHVRVEAAPCAGRRVGRAFRDQYERRVHHAGI